MNGSQLENLENLIHLFVRNHYMKSNWWLHFHWYGITLIRNKCNTMVNLNILLAKNSTFLLWLGLILVTHTATLKPNIWCLIFQVFKVSRDVFNIWIITLINIFSILLTNATDKILSNLNGVEIKVKTTQPNIV